LIFVDKLAKNWLIFEPKIWYNITTMKKTFLTIVFGAIFLWVSPLNSAMTGGDYSIPMDGFVVSDGVASSGGDYSLSDSMGDFAAGDISAGDYVLKGGIWSIDSSAISSSFDSTSVTLDFGATPLTTVASDSIILTVTTDSITGYAATATEDGNLRSGANDIDDVSDGSVTAGSEEYGFVTSGGDGQLASDTAIDGTVTVASKNSSASGSATTITFKAGISASTVVATTYEHTVTFSVSVNP
jgi:hypothetical protein